MKGIFCAAVLFLAALPVWGDEPLTKQYLAVYNTINAAERCEKTKDSTGALKAYEDAYTKLGAIQDADPTWEPMIVYQRLRDLKAKISAIQPMLNAAAGKPVAADPFQFRAEASSAPAKYEWRTDVIADLFWISEDKQDNAWHKHWAKMNGGDDSPQNRDGYAAGDHASLMNPFYVALPFNDLANADATAKWVPEDWKAAGGGSRCEGRWVEIKTAKGEICYAQWVDFGPGWDRPDYVFGKEAAGDKPAISLSPAVAECLAVEGQGKVSWRFVKTQDVRPGPWGKLNEQAILFRAMHGMER